MKKHSQFVRSGSSEFPESPVIESAELSLALCGHQTCEPGAQYHPKTLRDFLLCAIPSGKGTYTVSGVRHDVSPQDMLLIFPGTDFSFTADPQEGCRCIWVGFTGIRAEEYMLYAGFSHDKPCRRSQCAHWLETILAQSPAPQIPLPHQLRANGYFKVFLGELMEEYAGSPTQEQFQPPQSQKSSEYVKNAISYISQHYPENLKIKELANFVGINRSYLASSFKKATGYSPKEYLLRLRMEKAKSLLETTQMPISSISGSVGYEDPLAFSRIFKRYSGLSPTDYREKYKSIFEE